MTSNFSQANQLLRDNQLKEAVTAYSNAINNNPNFYLYHHNLGEALEKLERFEEAIKAYEKAIQLEPKAAFSYFKLSENYEKLGYNKKASQAIDYALKLDSRLKEIQTSSLPYKTKDSQEIVSSVEGSISIESKVCAKYKTYPDLTGQRQAEGGLRLSQGIKSNSKEKPLVSIITAVYNNSTTFERCINSVINQTYSNIEYIVVDGGSDKPTLDLLEQYSNQIDYYVSEPDDGIYNAMNKGLELAFGDYICVLNSDDWYDKNFVSLCINKALENKSSIVYTYCQQGEKQLIAQEIDEGILLGNNNLNHGAFLVTKNCYNRIGKYPESYRIISDVLWIRRAFLNGEKFDLIEKSLFYFSEGGFSAGNTEEKRNLMISERVKSTIEQFSFLEEQEAENIYLFRFNKKRISQILPLIDKYPEQDLFIRALAGYIKNCFKYRDNFKLSHTESDTLFPLFIQASEKLSIPKSSIRINTKQGCFSEIIKAIDNKINQKNFNKDKVIIHYVSVFSSPSESFIYELLCRLEQQTVFDNYILYDHKRLEEERPYQKGIYIPWKDFRPEVRNEIYKYIFAKLNPDVIIAHFALNEWTLSRRLKPLNISISTISMTHGIDVFSMRDKPEYKNYLLNDFSKRDDTLFTTVSNYLKNELESQGIPQNKINLVNNTVNENFFAHRKQSNFFQYDRTLNLLAIGRLVEWKGHAYLLEGIKYFKDYYYSDLHLTIVYGKSEENYNQIINKIEQFNLTANVSLVPFIDFYKEPDFFKSFDIFIQPSTYSQDSLQRSETFGVAPLEAIVAGLPVIVTDAGGLPEVVGYENRFAKIVPHANGIAIGKALQQMYDEKTCFSDNSEYAKERISKFSNKNQIISLAKLVFKVTQSQLNTALFSTSTIQGAGYAAFRIHQGLRQTEVNPTIFTTVRNHESFPNVKLIRNPVDEKAWKILQSPPRSKEGLTIFTMNHPFFTADQITSMVEDFDIINLHWTARFLSIENVAQLSNLGKPLVITIRDMNPITGGCHFFHGCQKWKENCQSCPQLLDTFDDFPSKVINAKRRYYNFNNITLVTLSKHTAEIVKQTPYFNQCRLEIIPNSIETDVFKPYNKIEARKKLGLPLNRKIIGYVPSFSSTVKGYQELLSAFDILKQWQNELDPFVMLVGNKTPANDQIKFDNQSLGYIKDNEHLSVAYSAADVVVVPSLEETFSNTTAESISCGTPVVGFKTGAIPDMVQDGVTGYTFQVGDVEGLAKGIYMTLTGNSMSQNCREYAENNLSFMLQARRYEELFYELYTYNINSSSYQLPSYFPETTPTVMNLLASKILNK